MLIEEPEPGAGVSVMLTDPVCGRPESGSCWALGDCGEEGGGPSWAVAERETANAHKIQNHRLCILTTVIG